VVGAPNCTNPDDGGRAFLLTSNAGNFAAPTVSTWVFAIVGGQAGAALGQVVAGLGDTNGDGAPDFAVAAPLMDSKHGRIYIFNGKTAGLPNTTQSASMSPSTANQTGSAISSGEVKNGVFVGHDINGDGFMDMIEGEPTFTGSFSAEGRAVVFLGRAGAIGNPAALTLNGTCASCNFGSSVALGDVGCTAGGTCSHDPDQYSDAVVGQPGTTNGALSKAGQVQIFAGQW
jgi:hypothetical protein